MPQLEIMKDPQCLVETDKGGKMTVVPAVLNQLKCLDKEVVVVAIAGPYRTGKSYLMNRLAGQNNGFALGSTIQSKTKGIWIWLREHPKQQGKYFILLDTEGLEDVEKGDENHDNKIICLSVLLASVFVYNVMGVIGNDAIRKLHFVTELSKHIQVRSPNDSKADDSCFDLFFPYFVYAIRDFTLDLEIDGKEVTADQYLEHCLAMKPGEGREVKNFNKLRQCIRNYFRTRKCFTFVPPIAGKCRNLDKVSDDKLLPEFLEETDAFVNYIFEKAPMKQITGKKLTGNMLASLVEAYVTQMATGVPYVENVVETMAQMENERAKQEAVVMYQSQMLDTLIMPVLEDSEISHCHKNCVQKAVDHFLQKAIFDQDKKFQKELTNDIEIKYREVVQQNESSCRKACGDALERGYSSIQEKMSRGDYTRSGGFRILKNDMDQFVQTFQAENSRLASKMHHVLLEFLHSKKTEEDAILRADENVSAAEKKQEEERQRATEMERQKKEAERGKELATQMLKDQEIANKKMLEKFEVDRKKDMEALQKHFDEIMKLRLAEQERLLNEGFKEKADELKRKIEDLERLKREAEEMKRKVEELERTKREAEARQSEMEEAERSRKEAEDNQRRIEELERQCREAGWEWCIIL